MRAELPWNVAGIPPEAREAARAAARREGLSVGEWLTRRILRSFSDMGEEAPSMPYDRSYERAAMDRGSLDRAGLDPWGLPPSPASRRDTEDMLSRVSRSEAESSDAYRRIEEHLRTVSRRLDSAERSQSENNRVMSKTTTEINIATREQAQAFDQLGGHVMNLGDRMERLERAAQQDGLKDAVKALHQGLSRLADQITQTASQSAQQVSVMTGNLEQMAARLGQVRSDVESATRRLEQRVSEVEEDSRGRAAVVEESSRSRFAAFEAEIARTLDQRLATVEKASQFNTNALDHALEKLEAQSGIRAGDQAELQRRHAETDGAISALEENLQRLEAAHADPSAERRLDSIERALGSLVSRLETYDPAAPLEDTLRAVTRRMDTVEKNNNDLIQELRANLAAGDKPAVAMPEAAYDAALFEPNSFAVPDAHFEAPPFAEAPPPFDPDSFDPKASFPSEPPPLQDHDPFAADAFATGAFVPPPEAQSEQALADENFLAAARRSVRAASETDAGRSGKLFSWGTPASDSAETSRPRYLVAAIIAGILVLALVGGVVLSRKMPGGKAGAPAAPVQQEVQNNAPFTPVPENLPSPNIGQNLPQRPVRVAPAPQGQIQPANPAPQTAQPSAAAPAGNVSPPNQATNKGSVPTLDRVSQLANSGNATAQTILGLKELDGDGVPANPVDAAKWLERAAEQGQPVAQYRLGAVYERGQGVAANPAIATHWYQLAANQGNRKAMHNLAVAFASGTAGKKDMAEAARWFAKAAALGLSDSQFNLAVLYERGDGVPQSLLDAYKWYAIAAANGDAESKTRLGVLSAQLSDDDRNAAQKSAATFHAAPLNRAANVPPEMADLSSGN